MAEVGYYLYAVSRGIDDTALAGCPGLGGGTVHVVEHRGLAAVVSSVDLDEFGEDALRRNLEDLTWLEKVARGHDTVVQTAAQAGPTAPMRLATIFTSEDGVRARLDETYDALQGALDRVQGRMEWSVKAYARGKATGPAEPPTQGPVTGAAYLQRKKAQTLQRQTAEESALRTADEVHAALASRCVASRRLRPQDPRLTGHEGTMTLNGAYLVEIGASEEFSRAATALAEQYPEARIEVHGPWPPYSFATLEQP